jgi:hypothetical protein
MKRKRMKTEEGKAEHGSDSRKMAIGHGERTRPAAEDSGKKSLEKRPTVNGQESEPTTPPAYRDGKTKNGVEHTALTLPKHVDNLPSPIC